MPRTSIAIAIGALGVLAVADDAAAAPRARRPPRAPSSFFLAADPHVPLAVVSNGRVRDAVAASSRGRSCGARARWARIGSRWQALDAWGQVVGTFTVSSKDDYDVTGCAELGFSPELAGGLNHVFVSVDSSFRASPSAEWKPTDAERSAFDAIVQKKVPDHHVRAERVWSQCRSIAERTRFFEASGERRFAVGTTNAGYLVARLDARGWSIVASEGSKTTRPIDVTCYRPVAVFDMNGDGQPEIVMRGSQGTWWGDFVLGATEKGPWRTLASSAGGSTA